MFVELEKFSNYDNIELSNFLTKDEVTPMIHLYRAEAGRVAVYKQRIDTTVHWLITCSLFIWTLCMQGHISFVFSYVSSVVTTFIFHVIDVRRYMTYDLLKYRCNLMERGMYTSILIENNREEFQEIIEKNWKQKLIKSWFQKFNMDTKTAFVLRFRNIFIYMYLLQFLLFTYNLIVYYIS